MDKKLETIFDNSTNTLYIRYGTTLKTEDFSNNEFIIQAINELDNHTVQNVLLDIRGLGKEGMPSLLPLIEQLKKYPNVFTLVDENTYNFVPMTVSKLQEISSITNEASIPPKFNPLYIPNILAMQPNSLKKTSAYSDEQYYNEIAKLYLDMIYQDYKDFMPDEKLAEISALRQTNNVVIEQDFNKYIAHQSSIGEPVDSLPHAHGGRVFGDNKIHIYFPAFNNPTRENIEGVLAHELFHYFIRPEYLSNTNEPEIENINSDICEGLVDMAAIDFMKKHSILAGYSSEYANLVIFMREKLSAIGDKDAQLNAIFNSSIEEIITKSSASIENFKKEYLTVKANQTDFDKLVTSIASKAPHHQEAFKRNIMKLSARATSKEEALSILSELAPTLGINIENLISEYQNIHNQAQTKENASLEEPENFDYQEGEREASLRVMQENQEYLLNNPITPPQSIEQAKTAEKPHVFTMQPIKNQKDSVNKAGFVNIITLICLLMGLCAFAVLIAYYLISR